MLYDAAGEAVSSGENIADELLRAIPLPRMNKYIIHVPHPPQAVFMLLPHKEALYGGAAGGGKSDALLMAALQYVDVPGYAALILRRTFKSLAQEDAIMSRAIEWLRGTDAKWNASDHKFTFPSGATLTFGYLDTERDKEGYQSAAFQYIGWDELTQHPKQSYTYMFSRCRKPANATMANIPLRIRGATNPGNLGHEWVKQRFIKEGPASGRPFVRARLEDNPSLNTEEYMEMLAELSAIDRARLRWGNWDATAGGGLFKEEYFKNCFVDGWPENLPQIRRWDPAATEPNQDTNPDPDWAAGVRCAYDRATKLFYICHVHRLQGDPGRVHQAIKQVGEFDGRRVPIVIEEEPGSASKFSVQNIAANVVPDRIVRAQRAAGHGSKMTRMRILASRCELKMVRIVRGGWNQDLLDEGALISETTKYAHDDQWDAAAGAYLYLAKPGRAGSWGRSSGTEAA